VKIILRLFVIWAAISPTHLICEEFSIDQVRGLQLAFTRLPAVPLDQGAQDDQKTKPKSSPALIKPVPVPVSKPSSVPVGKPPSAPASSVPQKLEVKPVQISPIKQTPTATRPIGTKNSATQGELVTPSVAVKKVSRLQWLVGIGFDNGGDELGMLSFTTGSVSSIKANKGLVLNFGVLFPTIKASNFSTQVTIGYKIGGVKAGNGSVIWSAIPIEALEYYNMGGVRVGLGLSYHFNPMLEIKIPGSNSVDQYKNALGLVAQIGWAPTAAAYSIDLRYTSIKYQLSVAPNAPSTNGSSVGIYASYSF
jgi:hypothetical protein